MGKTVIMYQSRFFERAFPDDNQFFERVVLTDSVPGDRQSSLDSMRKIMLDQRFHSAVFIGGMEGVEEEYVMFRHMHPRTPAFPIASTGAAAGKLYEADHQLAERHPELAAEVSYLTLMRSLLSHGGGTVHPNLRRAMARKTFFSFHYKPDVTRAWVVRNSWVTKVAQGTREDAHFFDSSVFEASQRESDDSLKRFLREGMSGATVTCVLVGAETCLRR